MSGTQSTLAERFPKKASRTGSILIKDHPPDKKPKSDKASVPPSHEFDPTELPIQSVVADGRPESCGLVQRCVIIQKDENGFGLTVSGDNPVFVQLVKEDGAAMRAGVQTGDRIIKVNGTLVTHSNHVEVVKLIKSGSYVALTVLGRPPGLPQIPLSDGEVEEGSLFSLTSPHSPGPIGPDRSSSSPSPSERKPTPLPVWAMTEEYSRNPTPKLLKENQDAKKHIPQHQEQLSKPTGTGQDGSISPRPGEGEQEDGGGDLDRPPSWQGDAGTEPLWTNNITTPVTPSPFLESPCQRETPCHSPKTTPRDSLNSCPSPDAEDTPDLDSQSSMGSPSSRPVAHIIGAEDEDFDTEQEQMNGQCSCFQSIDLLKSRPAHLAAFIHHVVSQFDPAPLLCYLYAELYKQTSSKETRRILMDTFFIDKTASLKVTVPESIITDLERTAHSINAERKRPEPISEDVHRQYVQQLQDTLLPDIQKNLEDFRQKRSMGLTLAEAELARLDTERMRDRVAPEKERACAEHIISKIEDVLLTSQATEEDKCTTMQFVILSYMKQLGVKVKESRGLEHKPKLMNLFPKIKKSIKPEKDGSEEKSKKTRFPNVFPQRRPSRVDPSLRQREALEPRQRMTKPQLPLGTGEQTDGSSLPIRVSQSSEGSDGSTALVTSPPYSAPAAPDGISRESETGGLPLSAQARMGEGSIPGDSQDSSSSNTHFDFSPCTLEHLQEEEAETDKTLDTGTPRPDRSRTDPLGSGEVQSEDDQCVEVELEPSNWQTLVSRDVLSTLTPQEIKRQEVINELFYTERAHVRMMKVLENLFYQPLIRDSILPSADIKSIFSNLEEIVHLHMSLTEQMAAVRKKNETALIDLLGDDLLSWFSGEEEAKIKRAAGTYCSNQPFALELIKSKQKKDQRFNSFIQEAESNRNCRRLQLKDIIPVETQRLTKYPLLLENIAKYTEDPEERSKVKRAGECCRKILTHVNQEVKEAENKQRLEDYQRRLDLSSLKQSENPMIAEFKILDLTKRKMVHEGPLSWKVNKDKTIELYTLLLEDILVLLQRQDEKLILKCHSKNLAGTAETKHIFSPIIKLSTVMVRSVATDNRSFFVLSMSDNGAQIYELMAQTVSEQKTWQCLITQSADSMKTKLPNIIPLPQTDGEREEVELINSGVPKLNKDAEPISLGSIQSPEKDDTEVMSTEVMSTEVISTPPSSTNPFETKSDEEDEEEENLVPDQAEDDEAFVVADMTDRLTLLKQRSRLGIAIDEDEAEAFELQPLRADEALRTLATLRQLLINHMSSQEDTDRDPERGEQREHVARTGSQQGPENSAVIGSTVENGSERGENRGENAQELPSGDTGFFETSEDCVSAGSYMVLEVYGGSGESSTDDDVQANSGEPVAGGDSGIDLKKLLSSSSQSSGGPNVNRQIMTHIRLLQANLQHLKDTEIKYNQLRQRLSEETATDTEENKDRRRHRDTGLLQPCSS
ncbi:rho guanine nucleotide exchange factor 12 isoform X4 [Pimephales promelas]|uniref:rho guanine nucleotide exchange factor 12 isoform X4 n=1 Tax=Pimephales promelas TaxID=90988 RepID=UPI0019558D21|nr:rho guanine nucleotide exchange factor 12 isoform X4 [Pimephales promelas]